MKTIKMYLNYSNFYKLGKFAAAPGDIFDVAEIVLPDNWELTENKQGEELIITDNGVRCLPYEVQTEYSRWNATVTPVPYFVIKRNGRPSKVYLKANIKRS